VSVSETELRRAVTVLDQYRAQLEMFQRQQEVLSLSLEELLRAKETMTRYRKAGKGAEVLFPIGANAFLFGTSANPDQTIIGIGSDLLVQEPIPKAVERLDERIKSLQEALGGLSARTAELDARVTAQEEFVQSVYDQISAGQAAPAPGKRVG
jgi:prefoldin alpha subunit